METPSSPPFPPSRPSLHLVGIALSTAFGRGLTAAGHSFSVTFAHRDPLREAHSLIEGGFLVDMRPIAHATPFVSMVTRAPILSLEIPRSGYRLFLSHSLSVERAADDGSPSDAVSDAFSRVLSWAPVPSHVSLDEIGLHGFILYWHLRGARVAYRRGDNLLFHRSSPSLIERREFPPSIPWTPNESIAEPIPLAASTASLSSPFHAW